MLHNISIVTISHNEENNIANCLSSLCRLDYQYGEIEIIVVDSSSDNTRNIVLQYPDVRLIKSDFKGFTKKRNLGIMCAKFELIAFIDADCTVPIDWLSKITSKINNINVAAVAGNAFPPSDSPFIGKHIACLGKPAGGAIGFDSYANKLDKGIDVVATTNTIFRKSVLLEVGGFDEIDKYAAGGEDWNISQKIRDAGYILEFEPEVSVFHKTRRFKSFLKWSFRNGKAQYLLYDSDNTFLRLILNPFSIIWPISLTFLFFLLPIFHVFIALLLLLFIIFIVYFFKYNISSHKGVNKLLLLISRREIIGVNFFSIFMVVAPLFYLDKLIINLGHLSSRFSFLFNSYNISPFAQRFLRFFSKH